MKPVNIGTLNRRVKLMLPTNTQSSTTGEVVPAPYTELAEVWASVEMGSGKEAETADQLVNVQRATFIIRMRNDINAQTQLQYENEDYEITAIHENTDARKQGYLIIKAYKKDSN